MADGRDRTQNLGKEDRSQIVEWHTQGFTPKEMSLKFAKEYENKTITEETIEQYLSRPEVKEEIQTRKSIKEKEAEYTQEELIRDLKKLKEEMWTYFNNMKDEGHGMTANDAAKNMLQATKQLGDYLDAFDSQSMDANVVKINELNINNITHIIEQAGQEEKEDIVERLENDPDIENFMIQRKENAEDTQKTDEKEIEHA